MSTHYAAMNARESDIFAKNVPQYLDVKTKTRPERKARVDVRTVRARLVTSQHTSLNGEVPRKNAIREKSKRCERRQLPLPQRP